VRAGQEIRNADREADDVAAGGFELLGLSATIMIALGLARLMRAARVSMDVLVELRSPVAGTSKVRALRSLSILTQHF